MAFDIKKTIDLIKGGLLDPRNTWTRYLGENPSWQDTAIQLTGPLLIANVLRSYVAALGRPVFATAIIGGSVLVAARLGSLFSAVSVFAGAGARAPSGSDRLS